MAEVTGVGMQGSHGGDRLGQAVGWGSVGLGAQQGDELAERMARSGSAEELVFAGPHGAA
jgi:hypothetical protein